MNPNKNANKPSITVAIKANADANTFRSALKKIY
jgi:hypothetical protein